MFAIWMQRWVRHVHDATVADVIDHITAPPEKRTIYHEIEASLPEAERLWFQGRLALELMLRNWMGWCKYDRQFRWVHLWKDELYPGKPFGEHQDGSEWDDFDPVELNRHDILKPFDYDVMDRLWGRDGWLMTYAPNATLEGMRLDLIEQGCTLPFGPATKGAAPCGAD